MAHNKLFISWLHNAHAMETELVEVLKAHANQAEEYPDVQAKIEEHLAQTKNHAEIIKNILVELGEDTSAVKAGLGSLKGTLAGASTGGMDDRLVKNAVADFAAENMEIATYNALITACEKLGHGEFIEQFKSILSDEEDMANWLENNLEDAVNMVIERYNLENTNEEEGYEAEEE